MHAVHSILSSQCIEQSLAFLSSACVFIVRTYHPPIAAPSTPAVFSEQGLITFMAFACISIPSITKDISNHFPLLGANNACSLRQTQHHRMSVIAISHHSFSARQRLFQCQSATQRLLFSVCSRSFVYRTPTLLGCHSFTLVIKIQRGRQN